MHLLDVVEMKLFEEVKLFILFVLCFMTLLVKGLRYYRPHRAKKKQNIKKRQYCNKFNKDFKNGPPQKRKKKVTGQQRQPKVEVPGGSPSSNLLMDGGRSVLRC